MAAERAEKKLAEVEAERDEWRSKARNAENREIDAVSRTEGKLADQKASADAACTELANIRATIIGASRVASALDLTRDLMIERDLAEGKLKELRDRLTKEVGEFEREQCICDPGDPQHDASPRCVVCHWSDRFLAALLDQPPEEK